MYILLLIVCKYTTILLYISIMYVFDLHVKKKENIFLLFNYLSFSKNHFRAFIFKTHNIESKICDRICFFLR